MKFSFESRFFIAEKLSSELEPFWGSDVDPLSVKGVGVEVLNVGKDVVFDRELV